MNALAPSELAISWAARITATWRQSVEAVIETGRLIASAKAGLQHGEFTAMCETQLPFKINTAQRLMAIAADPRIANAAHVQHLPSHWGTLYELTKLDDDAFDARIEDGTINPAMERKDITTQIKQQNRQTRERDLGAKQQALPQKKYGVILADPEWKFKPWSQETGMDRAADNHYPTSELCDIAARDVLSIAADDSVLYLWGTIPMLPQQMYVMRAWGFEYKSAHIWGKDKLGLGYWARENCEILLIGTCGKPPAPAPGTQRNHLIMADRGEHSAKPECFLEMIERHFPTLPKIELNRRGPTRPGWDAWGNEVTESDATPAGAVMAARSGATSGDREQSPIELTDGAPPMGAVSEPAPRRGPAPASISSAVKSAGAAKGAGHPSLDAFEIPPFLRRNA